MPAGGARSTTLFHRMARLPGSPYFIAAGFACGAAISFTPFVGMHHRPVLPVGLGAAVPACWPPAIGTWVGNPWTFPFIWIWIYTFGKWILDVEGAQPAEHVDFLHLFGALMQAFLRLDIAFLFETAWPVFFPMFVGGLPTAIVAWFLFYFPLKPVVATYQHRRRARRIRKAQEERDDSSVTTGS